MVDVVRELEDIAAMLSKSHEASFPGWRFQVFQFWMHSSGTYVVNLLHYLCVKLQSQRKIILNLIKHEQS